MRVAAASALILVMACRTETEQTQETHVVPVSSVVAESAAVAWTVKPTRHYLTCSPTTVGPDSILVLRMRPPHGASLHIGSPDKTPYIVVFHGQGEPDRS